MIEPGDTLWGIAEHYKIKLDELKRLNPGVDPKKLQLGQKIKLREEPVYHVIQDGDTFWALAKRYETTVKELKRLNPGVDVVVSL